MIQYRNVSADDRALAYGVLQPQWVPVDGIITVDDETAASFDCQPEIWARLDVTSPPAPAAEPDPPAEAVAPAAAPAVEPETAAAAVQASP